MITSGALEVEQLAFEMPAAIDEPWRRCVRCVALGYEGWYPLAFFQRRGAGARSGPRYQKFCDGCRDELDEDRRLRRSLGQRVRHHAKRMGVAATVYRERYGMTTDALVPWFKRKWESGELDCGCRTEGMNHGWRDAEIDQRDPNAEPFFPSNWQIMCSVHNNSKGRSRPETFAARQRGWELFRQSRRLGVA